MRRFRISQPIAKRKLIFDYDFKIPLIQIFKIFFFFTFLNHSWCVVAAVTNMLIILKNKTIYTNGGHMFHLNFFYRILVLLLLFHLTCLKFACQSCIVIECINLCRSKMHNEDIYHAIDLNDEWINDVSAWYSHCVYLCEKILLIQIISCFIHFENIYRLFASRP